MKKLKKFFSKYYFTAFTLTLLLLNSCGDGDYSEEQTEDYSQENPFVSTTEQNTSTFSIDVDGASYANARRFITDGQLPPKDVIRIEEFINYFDYDYPFPKNENPFAVYTELGECPWNKEHHLVHIGLQGKTPDLSEKPNSNLVFLIDVSGSMSDANKLPLLKESFSLLVDNLAEDDKISIVIYANAAELVLSTTSGANKQKIMEVVESLEAQGSTAGSQGLELAYEIAQENHISNGNNRVIIASDGDFNVGRSSDYEMQSLVEEKRKEGVFITVLGFGMDNYKDSKMEIIADKGNGNYYYIDGLEEAEKVLVNELSATLFTIAKDVKIQVEFDKYFVKSYRLIGYENRVLNNEDFEDDTKDAGEIGMGHTVTALYEIELTPEASEISEIIKLKLRYKEPEGNISKLLTFSVKGDSKYFNQTSDNFRFATSVVGFGLLLKDSEYKGNITYDNVLEWAKESLGQDNQGYRQDFIQIVREAQRISTES